MAKKQTFEDKVNKKKKKDSESAPLERIKVIHAHNSKSSGHFKFKERMYTVPNGKKPDQFVQDLLSK